MLFYRCISSIFFFCFFFFSLRLSSASVDLIRNIRKHSFVPSISYQPDNSRNVRKLESYDALHRNLNRQGRKEILSFTLHSQGRTFDVENEKGCRHTSVNLESFISFRKCQSLRNVLFARKVSLRVLLSIRLQTTSRLKLHAVSESYMDMLKGLLPATLVDVFKDKRYENVDVSGKSSAETMTTTMFEDLGVPPIYPESYTAYPFSAFQKLQKRYNKKMKSLQHNPKVRLQLQDKWLQFMNAGLEAQLNRPRLQPIRYIRRKFSDFFFGSPGNTSWLRQMWSKESESSLEDKERSGYNRFIQLADDKVISRSDEESIKKSNTGANRERIISNINMEEPISEFSDEYLQMLDPVIDRKKIEHLQYLRKMRENGTGAPDLESNSISLADMAIDFFEKNQSAASNLPRGALVGAGNEPDNGRLTIIRGSGYRVPPHLGGNIIRKPLFQDNDDEDDDEPLVKRPVGRRGSGGVEYLRRRYVVGGILQLSTRKRLWNVSAYFVPLVLAGSFIPKLAPPAVGLATICAAFIISTRGAPKPEIDKFGRMKGSAATPSMQTVALTLGLIATHGAIGAAIAAFIIRWIELPLFLVSEGVMAMSVTVQMWIAALLYKTYIDEYGHFDAFKGYASQESEDSDLGPDSDGSDDSDGTGDEPSSDDDSKYNPFDENVDWEDSLPGIPPDKMNDADRGGGGPGSGDGSGGPGGGDGSGGPGGSGGPRDPGGGDGKPP